MDYVFFLCDRIYGVFMFVGLVEDCGYWCVLWEMEIGECVIVLDCCWCEFGLVIYGIIVVWCIGSDGIDCRCGSIWIVELYDIMWGFVCFDDMEVVGVLVGIDGDVGCYI